MQAPSFPSTDSSGEESIGRRPVQSNLIRATLALCALCCAVSCTNLPVYSTEIGNVTAHADDPESAADLARRGWQAREAVTKLLPGSTREDLVLVERRPDQMPGPFAHGYTETPSFGALRSGSGRRIFLRDTAAPAVLTHELVHASLGAQWRALPPVLEEGLADHLAFVIHPDSYLQVERWQAALWREFDVQVEHVLAIGESREAGSFTLRLSPGPTPAPFDAATALELSASQAFSPETAALGNRFYGLGFAMVERLVERIGLDGLHHFTFNASQVRTYLLPGDVIDLLGGGEDLLPRAWLERRLELALQASLLDFPELRDLVADRYARALALDADLEPAEFATSLSLRFSVDDRAWTSWRDLPGYESLIQRLERRN